ncbi:hypothetical protein LCGC14_2448540 [marine sediment metagenome]|uniref:Aminotransferase class V domain-containing protein n=1 Tax=marine sediment metagenome TaxID=412755 RepID=A0A0F9BH41_9ZZZZ
MTRRIYMDNSATSFPKPAAVTEAMVRFAEHCGASAGRGAYQEAKACGEMIAACRVGLAELINAEGPERIVFTLNCSEALAIGIRGVLNTAGDAHAVTTVMDHNSALRPLAALAEQTHLAATYVQADPETSLVDPGDVRAISAVVRRLLADPGRRAELVALGNRRYPQFTWERTATATLDVYRRALAKRGSGETTGR